MTGRRPGSWWQVGVPVVAVLMMLAVLPATADARVRPAAGQPSPAAVDFGTVQVGDRASRTVTLTNTGGRNLTIDRVGVAVFTPNLFVLDSDTCQGRTLRPGRSCRSTVSFTPFLAGIFDAQLVFEAANTPPVELTGMALAPGGPRAWISPPGVNFGNVPAGEVVAAQVTLTNVGGDTLVMGNNTMGEDPNSFITDGACQGVSLAAGQSCTATVWYAPRRGIDSGDQTGNLWFLDPGNNVWAQVPLAGTAT